MCPFPSLSSSLRFGAMPLSSKQTIELCWDTPNARRPSFLRLPALEHLLSARGGIPGPLASHVIQLPGIGSAARHARYGVSREQNCCMSVTQGRTTSWSTSPMGATRRGGFPASW